MSTMPRKYSELPWYQLLTMVASLAPLRESTVSTRYQGKSLTPILEERTLRYTALHSSVAQRQFVFETTYKTWTKQMKLDPVVNELEESALLLWIGRSVWDAFSLLSWYHWGCYFLPVIDFILSFWRYVQVQLKKQHCPALVLPLVSMATFPTPAKQVTLALQFLFEAGPRPGPESLHVVGDSAGGNLVLQVLSNMLHPYEEVPQIRLDGCFRSLGLFSLWVSFTADTKSFHESNGIGFLDSGEREVMRDDAISVAERLEKYHANTELVVQESGIHDD
ncbi:hypothetical protein B0H13DRAFT_2427594 [Mycena leptocephala]|nr:hypothetical protein B0H13DRAFT_2427594 [Mycena leptocephala]